MTERESEGEIKKEIYKVTGLSDNDDDKLVKISHPLRKTVS